MFRQQQWPKQIDKIETVLLQEAKVSSVLSNSYSRVAQRNHSTRVIADLANHVSYSIFSPLTAFILHVESQLNNNKEEQESLQSGDISYKDIS